MSICSHTQQHFSRYLDGDVPGTEMLKISRHLERCGCCAAEFAVWRTSQVLVGELGALRAPEDLALRLRVAISQESRRSPRERFGRFRIRWQNTFQPLLLRAAAGFACALLLVGTVARVAGTVASPDAVEARDVPLETSSAPHLLYSSFQPGDAIGDHNDPIILQVFVDTHGRVYDYKVLSGQVDARATQDIENLLLFSVFAPARYFDQPVTGTTLMSFSGISVKG